MQEGLVQVPHGALTLLRGVSYAFFWKETEGPFRCCANWYHSPFALAGQLVFPTAEHALMYSKAALFGDTLSASAVLAAPTPKDAKALGRLVQSFDQALWDRCSTWIMTRLLIAKFAQNSDLLSVLLATGSAVLAEASPYDRVWGLGLSETQATAVAPSDWPGENRLGRCLEWARSVLVKRAAGSDAADPSLGPCSSTPRLDEVIRYPRVRPTARPAPLRFSPLTRRSLGATVIAVGESDEQPPPLLAPDLSEVPVVTPLPTSEQLVLLFLVATAGVKPLVFLPVESGLAVGAPAKRSASGERDSAVTQAHSWIVSLLCDSAPRVHAFLGGETDRAVRVVVAPLSVSPPSRDIAHKESTRLALRQRGVRFAWFALAALTATPLLHHAAGLAVQRVRTFSDLGAQLPATRLSPESPFLVGARSVRALAPRPAVSGTPGTRTVAQELSLRTEHERLLKEGLNVPHSHPHAPYLHSLIDRVGVLDLADLTAHDQLTSEKAPSFGDPNFRAFRFSEQPRPPETEYESPVLAQPIHCYETAFTDPRQLLTPECAADLFSWLDRARVDICNVRDDPSCRHRPPPFVRGQSCFVPEARGCVFDLRVPGQVQPLAFNEALRTTLDTSSIHAAFPGGWGFGRSGRTWPDQRVLSYLEEGVRFEVKGLPLQIVLFSHLESAPMGFASLQSEVRRFMGLQPYPWMGLFTWPPFFPIRCLAHGAAGRVLEPDRWRSTTEAGGPRYILFDQDGVLVPALNELSKESGAPPEVKPRPDQLAHDVAILNSAAELIPDVVYMGTDDVKDFFQHLAIAPSEFWFSTFLTLLAEGDLGFDSEVEQIAFVSEYRLGFGHFIASNIAQRFSTLLVALIELEYEVQYREQLETHAALHPPLQEWLSQRAGLNQPGVVREDRLHTIKMYTDDLALAAVSVDGFIALLIAEHVVFARLNLIMAIAAKRTLGVSIQWLGVIFVTCAGLVFVPRNKILRAIASLRKAMAGEATLAELRSLLGLLEHVKGILRVSRSAMHGLWRPFKGNFDPAALYAPQPWAARKLLDWVSALARSSGSLILDLLPLSSDWLVSVRELAAFSMRVTASADAARAHRAEDRRGLGGYFHGFYFHFALVPFAMELLAIGILELLALIFAILTFHHLIPPSALVDFETDSLSSTFSLVDEIARTVEGQLAMGHLLASQAFLNLRSRSSAKHIFGSVNACADRASRNKLQELRELCKQLGVRATPVQPAAAAIRIFHDVLRAAAAAAGRSQEYFEYIGTVAADLRPPGQLPAPAAPLAFTPLPLGRGDPPRAGSSDCPLPQEAIQFLAQAGLMASINLARQGPSALRRPKERGAQSALAHALQQARSRSSVRTCGALPHGRPPDAPRSVVPSAPKESKLRKRQLRYAKARSGRPLSRLLLGGGPHYCSGASRAHCRRGAAIGECGTRADPKALDWPRRRSLRQAQTKEAAGRLGHPPVAQEAHRARKHHLHSSPVRLTSRAAHE